MIFCRKCGKQLPDDSLFCTACGTKVLNENPVTDTHVGATPNYNNSSNSTTYNNGSTNEPYSYLLSYPAIFNSMLEVEKKMLEKDYKFAQQEMRSTAEFIHKYLYEKAGGVEWLDHKGMLDALYAAGIYDANGYANFNYIKNHGNRAVHDGIFTPEVTKETYEKLKKETINFVNDYVKRNRKINPDMGVSTFNKEEAEKKYYYLANYPKIYNSMLNVEELMSKKDYRNAMQEMNSTVDFIFSTLSDKAGNYCKWLVKFNGLVSNTPIPLYLTDICMINKDSFNNFDYILKTSISSSRSRYTSPEKAKQSYDILITESKRFSNDYIGRKPRLHWSQTLSLVLIVIFVTLWLFLQF